MPLLCHNCHLCHEFGLGQFNTVLTFLYFYIFVIRPDDS